MSGIRDYTVIEEKGGLQWPYPDGSESSFTPLLLGGAMHGHFSIHP
jgi:hypothetical protein